MKIVDGKQIPEVGDIYCIKKDNKFVCRVTDIIYSEWGQNDGEIMIEYANLLAFSLTKSLKNFTCDYRYLGKAKNNLESFFFEAENDLGRVD